MYAHYAEADNTKIPSVQNNDNLRIFTDDNQMYINFILQDYSPVSVQLFTIDGRLLKVLKTDILPQGEHQYTLNITDIPTGIYLLKLRIANENISRKLIIN